MITNDVRSFMYSFPSIHLITFSDNPHYGACHYFIPTPHSYTLVPSYGIQAMGSLQFFGH